MNVLSIKRLIWLLIVALTLVSVARAETFRVDDIRVEGVQKVSAGTIFNYLPIKVGDTVDAQIIRNALLLHLIDNMDAKMNLFVLALEESAEDGDWTDRHNYFRIPLYKGDNETK